MPSPASWSNALQPWLRPYASALVAFGEQFGELKITSVFRSRSQQLALWNNRHNNPYPVAPPGSSKHEQGRAWDMVGDPHLLRYLGSIWNQMGGRWTPADPIHFEA